MYDRLEIADVTCPASRAVSNPLEVALGFPGGIVRRITIVIPDGHAGLTGLALGYGHAPVIPSKQPAYISGNDEVLALPVKDTVPGVPWAVFLCNLDLQPHTWQVRFEYDELNVAPQSQPVTIATPADLEAAATELLTGP